MAPSSKPGVSFICIVQKGCSVVFIQLVIRPFWADFDLRDRPPVYKTAALPLSYAGIPSEG
jgi:hypothetical protein